MRIGIDIDGVLRDFVSKVIFVCDSLRIPVARYSEWQWDIEKSIKVPKEVSNDIIFNTHAKEIFRYGPAFEENVKVVQEMIKSKKHDIIIVTHQHDGIEKHTYGWLADNDLNPKEVYMYKDKTKANCDILIDDYEVNLQNAKGPICYDQPWNQNWKGKRIYNLNEIYSSFF